MSEQQFILDKFLSFHSRIANRRVAIYGVGLNTKYVLEHIDCPEMIVGLADAQKAGQDMYGYHVYEANDLVGVADVVVIVARAALLRMIYERIKHLEDYGLEIYSFSGENLRVYFAENKPEFKNSSYWECSKEELRAAIDNHSVITFDIFDTLLMRSVIRAHDVFDLVQRAYFEEFGHEIPFSVNRIAVEGELSSICVPSYAQIYAALNEKMGLSASHLEWLSKKEMELEKNLLVPRHDMVDIFKYSLDLGKTVVIVSDMYFSSEFLEELLILNNVPLDGVHIVVSNELQATKESGKLFEILSRQYQDILHIGDNEKADIANARSVGIDAYYVMSASDMLLNSALYPLISCIRDIDDSLTLGRFAAKVLNSPFALCKGKGKVTIDSLDTIAEFFAPIMFSFLRWMIKTLNYTKEKSVILFMARDGFLMMKLFDIVNKKINLELDNMYFLASRDALSEKSEIRRNNYRKYIEALGILGYNRIYIYDIGTKGTSVARLQQLIGESGYRVNLICFNTFNISSAFPYPERVHSYLGDFNFYDLPYAFLKYYELLEILSAPNQTQFMFFDDDICPVFADYQLENRKPWGKIEYIQKRIISLLEEELLFDEKWHKRSSVANMPDMILSMISPKSSNVNDDIKDVFIFESHFEGVEQTNWWERIVT